MSAKEVWSALMRVTNAILKPLTYWNPLMRGHPGRVVPVDPKKLLKRASYEEQLGFNRIRGILHATALYDVPGQPPVVVTSSPPAPCYLFYYMDIQQAI